MIIQNSYLFLVRDSLIFFENSLLPEWLSYLLCKVLYGKNALSKKKAKMLFSNFLYLLNKKYLALKKSNNSLNLNYTISMCSTITYQANKFESLFTECNAFLAEKNNILWHEYTYRRLHAVEHELIQEYYTFKLETFLKLTDNENLLKIENLNNE